MDKVERYRDIVRSRLTSIANIAYSNPAIVHEAVLDSENDRYLVMSVGWKEPTHRLHFCLMHIDIIDGKIWRSAKLRPIKCKRGFVGSLSKALKHPT